MPNFLTVNNALHGRAAIGHKSSDGVTGVTKNAASSQSAIGEKRHWWRVGGQGAYAGEAVATSQPAIGKKRLAGAVLMTKALTRASCRDQPSAPATSHTGIGGKELATK